jgi:hypothetical protein
MDRLAWSPINKRLSYYQGEDFIMPVLRAHFTSKPNRFCEKGNGAGSIRAAVERN